MKVIGKSIGPLLEDPSRVFGILLYGSDPGLIRSRARQATRSVLGQVEHPFRLVLLPREEHGRLREELASLPLGGGRRVVRVQSATDALVSVIETSNAKMEDVLIILEALSLAPRSKLRTMAERGLRWAAVPSFPESAASITEIKQALTQSGLRATEDAIAFLAEELDGDFAIRQSELEKLSSFAADFDVIELDHAIASCIGKSGASLGTAVNAALAGDIAMTTRLLAELEQEGTSGAGLLAVLAIEMQRLLRVRAQVEQGSTIQEACQSVFPPIYPRQAASFATAVGRWSLPKLLWLGTASRSADIACKRAGARDFTIAARLLSTVATLANQSVRSLSVYG